MPKKGARAPKPDPSPAPKAAKGAARGNAKKPTRSTDAELRTLEEQLEGLQRKAKKKRDLATIDRIVKVTKEIVRLKRAMPLPPEEDAAPKGKPLTEQQRRFVEAFMGEAAGNGTKAARAAGYSGDDAALAVRASELRRLPHVQAAIEERQNEDPLVCSRVELQRLWSSVARKERQKQLVEGREIEAVPPLSEVRAASALLGKSFGMFVTRHKVEGEIGEVVVIQLPDNGREDPPPAAAAPTETPPSTEAAPGDAETPPGDAS